MYLLDTNVLILGIKGLDPDKAVLEKAVAKNKLCLSVVSIAEFLSQASNEAEDELEKLIRVFPTLPVDEKTARVAAEYRKKFLKVRRVQLLDYFLAAQAKIHNLTLVTNNKSDFPMKDIKIIKP